MSFSYFIEVSQDAVPEGGDDASSAKFYDLREIVAENKLAFDHYEILTELIKKRGFEEVYKI